MIFALQLSIYGIVVMLLRPQSTPRLYHGPTVDGAANVYCTHLQQEAINWLLAVFPVFCFSASISASISVNFSRGGLA